MIGVRWLVVHLECCADRPGFLPLDITQDRVSLAGGGLEADISRINGRASAIILGMASAVAGDRSLGGWPADCNSGEMSQRAQAHNRGHDSRDPQNCYAVQNRSSELSIVPDVAIAKLPIQKLSAFLTK